MNLNEVELCYVAALIDGLRLINEKAAERKIDLKKFDADALVHYVRTKGDRLVALHLGLRADAGKPLSWPTSENVSRLEQKNKLTLRRVAFGGPIPRPTGIQLCPCGRVATHKGWCAHRMGSQMLHIVPQPVAA